MLTHLQIFLYAKRLKNDMLLYHSYDNIYQSTHRNMINPTAKTHETAIKATEATAKLTIIHTLPSPELLSLLFSSSLETEFRAGEFNIKLLCQTFYS